MENSTPQGNLFFNKRFFKTLNYIVLFTMLHSTFVAPAQGIISAYLHKQDRHFYKGLGYMGHETAPVGRSGQQNQLLPSAPVNYSPVANFQPHGNTRPSMGMAMRVLADLKEGVIGICKERPVDSPSDNLFRLTIESVPQNSKAYLSYEVYGVNDHNGVARSINQRPSIGGHIIKREFGWSYQKEEIDAAWLKEGDNDILFTIARGADYYYKIRNLSIVFENSAENKALVMQQAPVNLIKNGAIYIKGFLRGDHPGAKIEAGGKVLKVAGNEFEGYIPVDDQAMKNKFIMVKASDANGFLGQELLFLDTLAEAERAYGIEENSNISRKLFYGGQKNHLSVDGAAVTVQDATLPSDIELSLFQLRSIDIAPLESGMVNVTKGGKAYRFLPDGTKFNKPVRIAIAYDSLLIPAGYSPKDIRTYFFDTKLKSWRQVEKDSIDIQGRMVLSKTTHFSDYINGIIQSPESPESNAFAPTMMSDIKAADPSSEMTFIAPPDVSQKGDANVGYPIKLPAGRSGMQPSLALDYSSSGGSGWLGQGWGLSVPSLSIETKWGIPLFDPAKETELYSLNGEQLMYPQGYLPHRHQDAGGTYVTDQQLRSSNTTGDSKVFIPRNQGSFSKIERLGSSPSTYYWKVTATNGTVSWYGGKTTSDVSGNLAVMRDENSNIIHWSLFMVEDVFGNNVKYKYESITMSGQSGQYAVLNGARSLYLNNIFYTGYNGTEGNYRVDFNRSASVRPDVSFNARLGVKQADPYLLESIAVNYQGQQIRKYTLGYSNGMFNKKLLSYVAELNDSNVEFYRHTFEYYNDVALNGNNLFKSSVTIDIPDYNANYTLGFGDIVNPSLLNTIQSTETGFSLRPSAGFQLRFGSHDGKPDGTLTVGASYGQNTVKNKGKVTLEDIDGDGLDDILYRHSDGLRYLSNGLSLSEDGSFRNNFAVSSKNVNNINDFYKSKVKSEIVFGDSWDLRFKKFFAGTQRVKSKSEAVIYFTDANNDGLIDIVNDGKVQFNRIDPTTNEPSFTTDSSLTPNMVVTGAGPVGEPPLQPEEEEEENNPQTGAPFNDNYDVVRVWIAPASGSLKITNFTHNMPLRTAPVNYSIERSSAAGSCTIFQTVISPSYGATAELTQMNGTCGTGAITVTEGDKLYFRVHKNQSGGNANLNLNVHIQYDQMYDVPYFNVSYNNHWDYNFNTNGAENVGLASKEEPVSIPGTGTVKISWDNFPFKQNDDVDFEVVQRTTNEQGVESDTVIYSQSAPRYASFYDMANPSYTDTPPAIVTASPNLSNITVTNPNTSFIFRAISDVNAVNADTGDINDWFTVGRTWRPHLKYTPDTASLAANISGFATYATPYYTLFYDASYKGLYNLLAPGADPESPGWSLPGSNVNYTVAPNTTIVNNFLTSSDNASFIFAVRDIEQVVIGKRIVNIVNGAIVLPDPTAVSFCASCNAYTISEAKNLFHFDYFVEEEDKAVFERYLKTVDQRPAVVSYVGNSSNNVNRTRVVSVNYNGYKHLGGLHNNWGQFLYNSHYDPDPNTPSGPFGKLINNTVIENPFAYSTLNGSAVVANNCDPNLPTDQYQACVEQSIAGTLNIPGESTDFSNFDMDSFFGNTQSATQDLAFEMPFLPMQPKRISANPLDDRYVGFYNNQYTGVTYIMSGGMEGGVNSGSSGGAGGGVNMPEFTDEDNETITLADNASTGMKAINKIHRSSSRSNNAGWGSFTVSNSDSGYSNTVTDFMDINGDGYPDIITSEKYQSTTMTGGHRESTANPEYGDVAREHSSFTGLTAAKSFAISGRKSFGGNEKKEGNFSFAGDYGSTAASISVSASVGGATGTDDFWYDVNGDGLPDRVTKEGDGNFKFQLNKGQNVSTGLFEPFSSLAAYQSTPGTFSGSVGFGSDALSQLDAMDIDQYSLYASFDYNFGYSASKSNTVTTFIDINGDGLSDLVSDGTVKYNTGTGFGASSNLTRSLDADSVSKALAASGSGSLYFGFPICCYIAPLVHIKAGISIGASTSLNLQQTDKAFKDLNGDGYVDYIKYNNGQLEVSYSAIGRTNMLKKVTNPLGGKFSIDYEANAKSYANPHSKWVMNKVTLEDGYDKTNDGVDSYITNYKYENGYYDRREREFYGFGTVKTMKFIHDTSGQPQYIHRTSVSKFHNRSYFLKGALIESYTMEGNNENALSSKTINTYEVRKLASDGTINLTDIVPLTFDTGGTEGRRAGIALLTGTTNYIYEFGTTPIVSQSELRYNKYGSVIKYINYGDIAVGTDDYTTDIDYHSSALLQDKNLVAIPQEMRITNSANELLRKRSTTVNDNNGTIATITVARTSSDDALTQLAYDQYGNLKHKTYPAAENGDQMFYAYDYDTTENKYVTKVTDAYSYTSGTTYDYKFDKILTQTDISGNALINEYDNFGRLSIVRGPNEIAENLPYLIKMDYYPKYSNLSGVVSMDPEVFMPVAVTSHYDKQHPGNDIQTYTFIDGLGRVAQIKKDIELDLGNGPQEAMSFSGKTAYNEFSLAEAQYHPWYEEKDLQANFTINEYESPTVSYTKYDVLDRVIQSTDAAGGITEIKYTTDSSGGALVHKTITRTQQDDSQWVETHSYTDANGRQVKTDNILSGGSSSNVITNYEYNAIGELTGYSDAAGIATVYTYDMMGNKTKFYNPDKGLTSYYYDNANHLVKVQTQSLLADNSIPPADRFIKYYYTLNQLVRIIYPDVNGSPNIANVDYYYGSSGNDTGRVVAQSDATGEQYFQYSALGQVVYNTRTVVGPNIPTRTFKTKYQYDSWNRLEELVYPDGEPVTYFYDLGGNVNRMTALQEDGSIYNYIDQLKYDHYEQRTYIKYGNGTETFYNYTPELRRLEGVKLYTSSQETMMDARYTYDKTGNIVGYYNTAMPNSTNKLGGTFAAGYAYDTFNRLVKSSGWFEGDLNLIGSSTDWNSGYTTYVEYNTTHGMAYKEMGHSRSDITVPENTYKNNYIYFDGTHQLKAINDSSTGLGESYTYDLNGNMRTRTQPDSSWEYYWDESNRLRVATDPYSMNHYIYDASGERVLKANSDGDAIYENGTVVGASVNFNSYTSYPSAFIVVDGGGQYTKHYYTGSQRIVSRVGANNAEIFESSTGGRMAASGVGESGENPGIDESKLRQLQISDLSRIAEKVKRGVPAFKKYKKYTPEDASEEDNQGNETEKTKGTSPALTTLNAPPNLNAIVYFYHSDNLGSATYLTDANGQPYQFYLNLPFGETLVEQHSMSGDYDTPYKFNGKELDKETGLYYYGARYYDPRTSIWMSTDPLMEKYPNINPYVYCAQNPVKYVDPDGQKIVIHYKEGKSFFSRLFEKRKSITYSPGMKYEGKNKFVSETVNALNYVRSADTEGIIDKVSNDDKVLGISNTSIGLDHYNDNNKNVYYNPQSGLEVSDENNVLTGEIQSAALGLLHEIGHAFLDFFFTKQEKEKLMTDLKPNERDYDNPEEKYVINTFETPAAEKLKEPTRKNHRGKSAETENSTSTKRKGVHK